MEISREKFRSILDATSDVAVLSAPLQAKLDAYAETADRVAYGMTEYERGCRCPMGAILDIDMSTDFDDETYNWASQFDRITMGLFGGIYGRLEIV